MVVAEGTISARAQLAAIARLRWRIFVNSLQTLRGRLEFVSRISIFLMMGLGGLGAGIGLAVGAFTFIRGSEPQWLAVLFWAVFFVWQVLPLLAAAFTPQFEFENLLRFPLQFRSFVFVSLVYGLLDPGAAAGCFWLMCITGGIAAAQLSLFVPAAVISLVYAAVNLFLRAALLAWLDRWLAQRRTREILGGVFIVAMLTSQFSTSMITGMHSRGAHPPAWWSPARSFARVLPPTLAGDAIGSTFVGSRALWWMLCGLAGFAALFFRLTVVRLRAQYRGENLSEAQAPVLARRVTAPPRAPARTASPFPRLLRFLPAPIAAVCSKELRYFCRCGPLLLNFVLPLFLLALFKFSPQQGNDRFQRHLPDFAFPIGAAYGMLFLANIIYNCFGPEGKGIQFYLLVPVTFREILLGKNLAYLTVMGIETSLLWIGVAFLFHPPEPKILALTISALLVALPVNLAAGCLLSLYAPKKFDFAMFGRQRASMSTVFASMGIQVVLGGVVAVTLLVASAAQKLWLASLVFLFLAAAATVAYFQVVKHCNRLALDRREALSAELCRE